MCDSCLGTAFQLGERALEAWGRTLGPSRVEIGGPAVQHRVPHSNVANSPPARLLSSTDSFSSTQLSTGYQILLYPSNSSLPSPYPISTLRTTTIPPTSSSHLGRSNARELRFQTSQLDWRKQVRRESWSRTFGAMGN